MTIPADIVPAGSILSLGSGFSAQATNILGKALPTGAGLKEEFARLLSVDAATYDMKTLADEIAASQIDLYQLLYKTFTVKRLTETQESILSKEWMRIYTTNYDDAVEFAYNANGNKSQSFSYDDPKPKKFPWDQSSICTE